MTYADVKQCPSLGQSHQVLVVSREYIILPTGSYVYCATANMDFVKHSHNSFPLYFFRDLKFQQSEIIIGFGCYLEFSTQQI